MSEFKYRFVNLLLLVVLGFGIYWAFTTIDNGIVYDKGDVVSEEIFAYEDSEIEEVELFDNTKTENIIASEDEKKEEDNLSIEDQVLVERLQGLVDDRVYMKKGSNGTRVGTVQEFLNIYFNTNKSVDNDYGPGTMSDVRSFQEDESLDSDGLAGPATYQKMIEILKS